MPTDLHNLLKKLQDRDLRSSGKDQPPPMLTGWEPIDRRIGGLAWGAVHEWFGWAIASQRGRGWSPPLGMVEHLAVRAVEERPRTGVIVWIGRRCWIWPTGLARRDDRLTRSVWVDAADAGHRLWAMDLAMRSAAVMAVIGDGSGLDMAATRRLQLSAKAGGAMALLVRPPWELDALSAAATRWRVEPDGSEVETRRPRWTVRLLRCKGAAGAVGMEAEHTWRMQMEWDRAQGIVCLSEQRIGGSGAAKPGRRIA